MSEVVVTVEAANWPLLVEEGIAARDRKDGAQWWLGDLALKVDTTESYGERRLERYASEIGVEYESLKSYRRVAAAYEEGARAPHLSYRHHHELAAREDRLTWLARAAENQWSTRQMLAAIEEADEVARLTISDGSDAPSPKIQGPDRTRQAIAGRREQVRTMARDGYRASAIADVVGLTEETVREQLHKEGIETVEQRIGKAARIDVNRAMDSLVNNAAPSELALSAIYADWDDLDRANFAAWKVALGSAVNLYRRLQDRLQKG